MQTADLICTHSMSQGENLSGRRLSPALARRRVQGEGSWEAASRQGLSPGERAHPGRPGIKGRPLLPLRPRLCHSVRSGGMRASSPASLPQPWASCVQGVGESQVPHLPKATFQPQPGRRPRSLEGKRGAERSAELYTHLLSTRGGEDSRTKRAKGPTCGSPRFEPQAHSTENARAASGPRLRKPPG